MGILVAVAAMFVCINYEKVIMHDDVIIIFI